MQRTVSCSSLSKSFFFFPFTGCESAFLPADSGATRSRSFLILQRLHRSSHGALGKLCQWNAGHLGRAYLSPAMHQRCQVTNQPTNWFKLAFFHPESSLHLDDGGAVGVATLLVSPALQQLGLRQPLKPVFSFSLLGSAQTGTEWKAGFPAQTGLSGSVLHGSCRGSTKRCFISVFSVKNPVPLTPSGDLVGWGKKKKKKSTYAHTEFFQFYFENTKAQAIPLGFSFFFFFSF